MKPNLTQALPFWISLLLLPSMGVAALWGSWWLMTPVLYGVIAVTVLDAVLGHDEAGLDPQTGAEALIWHRAITYFWVPLQILGVFGLLFWVAQTDHLATWEILLLFIGAGMVSGGIGLVYAHELIHQSARWERALGEILLCFVGYGHFSTAHLAVHHRHVATPNDPATARFNESFYRFFPRVLIGSFTAALRVENERTRARHGNGWHISNPLWRRSALSLGFALLAYGIAGLGGVGLFALQAVFAIWQLEQINYIEHYGLIRQKTGARYEPVAPHHSWDATHRITNYLLINLQRHADHHMKPARRYPVLQTYAKTEAPALPYGYPLLTWIVYIPPLWRRVMNPKVQAWRARHYPQVTQW